MKRNKQKNELTRFDILILEFFSWKEPLYAYEIDKFMTTIKLQEFLRIGLSTIYNVLKRLEKAGHLESEKVIQGNKPPKILYRMTEQGGTFLKKEMTRIFYDTEQPIMAFNMMIGSLYVFTKEEALALIDKRIAAYKEKRTMITTGSEQHLAAIANLREMPPLSWMTDRFIGIIETEIAWLTKWREQVQAVPWDKEAWKRAIQDHFAYHIAGEEHESANKDAASG